MLDCLWTGTPVIATAGDVIAEAMAQRGLASLVPPGDPAAVVQALMTWRRGRQPDPPAGPFQEMAAEYRWSAVCRPLADYLQRPRPAPDHLSGPGLSAEDALAGPSSLGPGDSHQLRRALAEAQGQLREREEELAATPDLLGRIARGKAMRLMNAAQSLWRRRQKG